MATYYWVGNGGNWSDSAKWSLTSGGAGGAGVPTSAADTAIVNASSMSVNSTINVDVPTTIFALAFNTIDVIVTLSNAQNLNITSNLSLSTNTTYTNGVIIDGNLTTENLGLTSGMLSLGSSNIIVKNVVNVTGTTTRSISFGTGSINISPPILMGSLPHWNGPTLTNFTATGSKKVNFVVTAIDTSIDPFHYSQILHGSTSGGTYANSLNLDVSGYPVNHNIAVTGHFNTCNFISGALAVTARTIYKDFALYSGASAFSGTGGAMTFASSGTGTIHKTITTNGVNLQIPIACSGINENLTLNDALTCRSFTLGSATLNLNGYTLSCALFSSATTTARTLNFNGGNIVINSTLTAETTVWSAATLTNFSYTGTWQVSYNTTGNFATRISHGTAAGGSVTTAYPLLSGLNLNTQGGVRIGGHFIDVDLSEFIKSVFTDDHTIYRDLKYSSASTVQAAVSAGVPSTLTFAGTDYDKSITSNGNTIRNHIVMNALGKTLYLNDALTIPYGYATFSLYAGTFDANGFNVTTNGFSLGTNQVGAKILKMGSGNWTLMGNNSLVPSVVAWNVETNKANPSFALYHENSTITILSMAASQGSIFQGGGNQYNDLVLAGDYTNTVITMNQSNTFNEISSTKTVPFIFQLQAVNSTTVNQWSVSGSPTGQATVKSNTLAGAEHTLIQASGIVSVSYSTIKDIDATGGATWNAYTSNGNINDGNNTGWIFTAPITNTNNNGGFFVFF